MNKSERICDNCGNSSGNKKYCSNACKVTFFYKKEKKENPNKFTNQKNRALVRKIYLIESRGGKCESCGYSKNVSALDFHHKDPSEKEVKLDSRHLSNTSIKKIYEEFEKCLVLCANCHREHHHPEMEFFIVKNKIFEFNDFKKIKHLTIRTGKPKCIDCEKEINYNSERCVQCRRLSLRKIKDRPTKEEIKKLISEKGITKTAKQYKVSRTTIKRWLK